MANAIITVEALARLTNHQRDTLVRLMQNTRLGECHVTTAFDLPGGYVTFDLLDEHRERIMYGGISAEGAAST